MRTLRVNSLELISKDSYQQLSAEHHVMKNYIVIVCVCLCARSFDAYFSKISSLTQPHIPHNKDLKLQISKSETPITRHAIDRFVKFVSVASLSSLLFVEQPRSAQAIDVLSEVISPADSLRSDKSSSFTQTTVTLPSGLQYYDAVVGSGPEVVEGKSVQFVWVLRRSNGYFVDSNAEFEPFIYKVGNLKKVMKGVDEGIRGMKQGGVRRLNIPPNLAFVDGVDDDKPGPIPSGFGPKRQVLTRRDREVWYMEVKVLKVKE